MPGGRSDEPFGLDAIELDPLERPREGSPVRGFQLTTLDRETMSLAALEGTTVFLYFWATWCAPCHEELASLGRMHERIADDPRFRFIGVNMDRKPDTARAYIATKNIAWPQAHFGDETNRSLRETFPVETLPASFLIGPDGVLLARHVSRDQLKSRLEAAP
ncbi:MAG: hypothetical protein CMJ18_08170 [Phycisphaeraceae bacterium]|nr:hypothetical protein [Phycisphaeraceae bacterium]